MRRTLILIPLVVALITLAAPRATLADAVLSVSTSPGSISVGDTFTVDVNITGVTDLSAFQFDLTFDPTLLSATNVTEGTFLSGGGPTFFIPGTIDNVGGSIVFNADTLLSSPPGVNGSGSLAVFDFTAIANGTSTLDLANIFLLDSTLANINFTANNGSVTIGTPAVPEPGTLTLLISAIISLAAFTRFKSA